MLALADFFDHLDLLPFHWSIQRNDQLSGGGDGRYWQAELAPPLWSAEITLRRMPSVRAEGIAARIRRLRGASETFLFRNPYVCGPRSDPVGTIFADSNAAVSAISTERDAISVAGLPSGYRLTVGDKLQITDSVDSTLIAFLEVGAEKSAGSGGILSLVPVFPLVPNWVTVGDTVTVIRPACKCIMVPGSHSTGSVSGHLTDGQSFRIIQKK